MEPPTLDTRRQSAEIYFTWVAMIFKSKLSVFNKVTWDSYSASNEMRQYLGESRLTLVFGLRFGSTSSIPMGSSVIWLQKTGLHFFHDSADRNWQTDIILYCPAGCSSYHVIRFISHFQLVLSCFPNFPKLLSLCVFAKQPSAANPFVVPHQIDNHLSLSYCDPNSSLTFALWSDSSPFLPSDMLYIIGIEVPRGM